MLVPNHGLNPGEGCAPGGARVGPWTWGVSWSLGLPRAELLERVTPAMLAVQGRGSSSVLTRHVLVHVDQREPSLVRRAVKREHWEVSGDSTSSCKTGEGLLPAASAQPGRVLSRAQ